MSSREAGCVPVAKLVELSGLLEFTESVLADGFEHRQPYGSVTGLTPDETPADEGLEVREKRPAVLSERTSVLQRCTVREDGERAVQELLALRQASVAPVDRARSVR
jgi:hypothetical protein